MVFSLGTLRPPLSSFGGGKRAVIYIRDTITSELLCSSTGQVASFLPLFLQVFFATLCMMNLKTANEGLMHCVGEGKLEIDALCWTFSSNIKYSSLLAPA